MTAFYFSFKIGGDFQHGIVPGSGPIAAGVHTGDGSAVTHFFGAAYYEAWFGLGEQAQDWLEWEGGQMSDWASDTAYAYCGADFANYFLKTDESTCVERVSAFIIGFKSLTGLLGSTVPANTEQGIEIYRAGFRSRLNQE
jgi:hypothetical protein